MDKIDIKAKLWQFYNRYKFVAFIILIGIILMLLPTNSSNNKNDHAVEALKTEAATDVILADILSAIKGAGEVKVLLSVATGEEKIYQLDENISDNSGSIQRNTVIVSDSSRNQQGLVRQVIPPSYLGAVIVCDGGDDPVVKLAVVDAVSKATGLTSDRISVIKMK